MTQHLVTLVKSESVDVDFASTMSTTDRRICSKVRNFSSTVSGPNPRSLSNFFHSFGLRTVPKNFYKGAKSQILAFKVIEPSTAKIQRIEKLDAILAVYFDIMRCKHEVW